MEHQFFSSIDWQTVYDRKLPPPFVPSVQADEVGDKYIPAEFKGDTVANTPSERQGSVNFHAAMFGTKRQFRYSN
jgi:hypothetical protein